MSQPNYYKHRYEVSDNLNEFPKTRFPIFT